MNKDVLDLIKPKIVNGHRKVGMKAFCSYTLTDWTKYYYKIYLQKTGKQYNGSFQKTLRNLRLLVYPIVFHDLKWSARDFAYFINKEIEDTKEGRYIATLNIFQHNKKFAHYLVDKFDKEFKKRRVDSFFESQVYIPFFSISSNQDDLILIFNEIKDKKCAFIYNYGIPCFCRYLEVSQNLSFEEAKKQTKIEISILLKMIKKREALLLPKFLTGFAKTSLLWEPYGGEDYEIFDWRKEMGKIWDVFSIREKKWWRTKSQMNCQPAIIPIKKFFQQ